MRVLNAQRRPRTTINDAARSTKPDPLAKKASRLSGPSRTVEMTNKVASGSDELTELDPNRVRVIVRAVDILDCLSQSRKGLGITELSGATGLSKSTVHNLLATLVSVGLAMVHPSTKRYGIGPKSLAWASAFIDSIEITDSAEPYLEKLRDLTRETAHLHVRLGYERTCVAQVLSTYGLRRSLPLGEKRPLWASATGRILMTALRPDVVREYLDLVVPTPRTIHTITNKRQIMHLVKLADRTGYECAFEETELDVSAVSIAIHQHNGITAAAITVSGPMSRWNKVRIHEMIPDMVRIGEELSRRLGWDGSSRSYLPG